MGCISSTLKTTLIWRGQELAGFTPEGPCPYTSTLTMNFFLALARLKIRREGQ
jgi:hypothetical protein